MRSKFSLTMFIVLDAIDGAGKGLQRVEVAKYLIKLGYKVKTLEFPVHDAFYETVIHPALQGKTKLNKASWVLSYLLDKTLHTDEIKLHINKRDRFLIADGYFTTTIAYQSLLMKQIEVNRLMELGVEFDIPAPDLAVYLDTDPKIAMQRKLDEEGHEEGLDIFEKSVDKQRKLREIFRKMVRTEMYCDWETVDGSGKIKDVTESIVQVLRDKEYVK